MFDYNSATSLDAALRYVALGFHVFPCHTIENGICSCGDPTCPDAGKHPLTDNGFYGATNDPDTVRSFFSGPYSIANVAIRTGGVSGVWVTDVDDPAAFAVLEARYGPLPKTWTVQTGSGGRHVYFRFADGCEAFMNSQRVAGCFDVRGDNGYVLAPPSLHRSGQRYRWLITPDDCELAIAPAWLTGLLPKRESLRPLNPTVCKKSFSDYSVTGNGNENGNVSASAYVSANVNDNASANVSAAQPDTHTEPEPARASETGTGTPTYTVQRARTLAERMALYLAKAPIAVTRQ